MHDPLLTKGPISGRFYSFSTPLEVGTSLVGMASTLSFRPYDGTVPPATLKGYCCSVPPYEGDLDSETSNLGYSDNGSGYWRMWIKVEERAVSRGLVLQRASQRCLEEGRPYSELDPKERKEYEIDAKVALMQSVHPKIHVIPVVLSHSWAWIGNRKVSASYRAMLYPVVGANEPEPLAWSISDEVFQGWNALSLAAVQRYARSGKPELDVDVVLTHVSIADSIINCRMEGASQRVAELLSSLLGPPDASHAMEVKSLVFDVVHDGESTFVTLDKEGFIKGVPPGSGGGLEPEILERRFGDVRRATERVGEVLQEVAGKISAG